MTIQFLFARISKFVLLAIFFALVVLTGCKKENEEDLFEDAGCNVEDITYDNTVRTILSNQCLVCHSAAARQGGIILETYNDILPYVTNGRLLGSITHSSGFVAMPPTGVKLDPCTIQKIQAWVTSGTPER
jgi:hypothetical protein